MRRLALTSGVMLVALMAACGTTTPPPEAAAGPAGPASPTAAPAGSLGDAPADAPPSPPAEATRTDPADLIIHPDHIGPLKIGMSLAAAEATGLIVVVAGQDAGGPDACVSAHWTGRSDDAWMVFNGEYGLRALDSFGNQRTPEGIRPGSSLAAVRRAYPHLVWRVDGDDIPDARRTRGDALVDAVRGDGAHYRITIKQSKVTDVQLESDRAGCYE